MEHVPGSWLERDADEERFRGSAAYKTLVVDAQLLSDDYVDVPSQRLVKIRERLLRKVNLHQDDEALATSARGFIVDEVAPHSS